MNTVISWLFTCVTSVYIATISIHTLCIVLMTLFAVNFLNVWWILGMFGSVLFPFASVRLEGNYEVFVLKYDMVTCCQGCWLESATLPHRIPLDAIRKPHIPSMLSRRSPMGMTSPGFSRSWSRSANNACRARRHCAGQCWESMTRMHIYIYIRACPYIQYHQWYSHTQPPIKLFHLWTSLTFHVCSDIVSFVEWSCIR